VESNAIWAFIALTGTLALSGAGPYLLRDVQQRIRRREDRTWEARTECLPVSDLVGRDLRWFRSRVRMLSYASYELRDGERVLATAVHRPWFPDGIAEGELLGSPWRLTGNLTFRDSERTAHAFRQSPTQTRREAARATEWIHRIDGPDGRTYVMKQRRTDGALTISDASGTALLHQTDARSWRDSDPPDRFLSVRFEKEAASCPDAEWLLLWAMWRIAWIEWLSKQPVG